MSIRKRGGSWYVDYYVDGRRVRLSVGPDRKLAEAVWADVKVKRYTGELSVEQKVPPVEQERWLEAKLTAGDFTETKRMMLVK